MLNHHRKEWNRYWTPRKDTLEIPERLSAHFRSLWFALLPRVPAGLVQVRRGWDRAAHGNGSVFFGREPIHAPHGQLRVGVRPSRISVAALRPRLGGAVAEIPVAREG